MLKESIMLYKIVKKLNNQLIPFIELLKLLSEEDSGDILNQIDTAFACRETIDILDEIKKKLHAQQLVCEKNAATIIENFGKMKTEYCTASPKPRMWYKVPYKRSGMEKEFDTLMERIGVSKEARENELVRFHGPGIADYCTKMIGECKTPPLDNPSTTELSITMRKSREVDG